MHHQPMRMRSKVRRCLVLHAQLKTSSTHAHAQKRVLLPCASCAAEGFINHMHMRSNVLLVLIRMSSFCLSLA
jgi:hypothetical protein